MPQHGPRKGKRSPGAAPKRKTEPRCGPEKEKVAFARERGCGTGLVGPAQKRAPSTRPPARRTAATGPKTNGEQKMSCGAGNISVRTKCKALFERFRNAANTEKAAPPEGPDRPAAFGPLRQAGPGCALPPKACGAKGPFLIPGCKQQKRKRFGGAPGSLRDALGLVVVAFCWARARAGWERAHEGPPTRNPVSFAFFSLLQKFCPFFFENTVSQVLIGFTIDFPEKTAGNVPEPFVLLKINRVWLKSVVPRSRNPV